MCSAFPHALRSASSERPVRRVLRVQPWRPFLGDIVIARGVARRQARAARHSERTELRVLALHGLLHLLGYDHERDDGRMPRVERRLRRKGGLREGLIERAAPPARTMIPLGIFLLACAAVYLGAIEAAFSALMRLSLRLVAERSDRPGALGDVSRRPAPAVRPGPAAARPGDGGGHRAAGARRSASTALDRSTLVIVGVAAFVVVFELLLPLLIVGRDPERCSSCCCRRSAPVAPARSVRSTRWIAAAGAEHEAPRRRAPTPDEAAEEANEAAKAYLDTGEQEGHHRRRGAPAAAEHRRLRRHAGPRGDDAAPRHRRHPRARDDRRPARAVPRAGVLAVSRSTRTASTTSPASSSSRIWSRSSSDDDGRPITPLLRPAVVVPETKRVPELLKQFQRQQTQMRDRRRRIRRHRRARHDRGSARGDRRRDPRRVRRRVRADRRRGQRPLRVQRQGGHRRGRAAAERRRSSAKGSRPSAAICCRTSAACRRSASASRSTA